MNDKELSAAFEKAAGTGDWMPIYDECVRARAAEYRLTNRAQQLDSESGWNETQWRRERKANAELHEQLAAAGKTIAGLQNTISRLEAEIRHLNAANREAYQQGYDAGESTWRRNLREQRLD